MPERRALPGEVSVLCFGTPGGIPGTAQGARVAQKEGRR